MVESREFTQLTVYMQYICRLGLCPLEWRCAIFEGGALGKVRSSKEVPQLRGLERAPQRSPSGEEGTGRRLVEKLTTPSAGLIFLLYL
jgi:hypothetical protein